MYLLLLKHRQTVSHRVASSMAKSKQDLSTALYELPNSIVDVLNDTETDQLTRLLGEHVPT